MENKKETLTAAEEQKRQQQFIEKARVYVREKSEELGRPLYACTTTFGCQMNARDSEKLDGILEAVGYIKTEKEETTYDDRTVWLYDAGSPCGGKTEKELPVRGSDLRNP